MDPVLMRKKVVGILCETLSVEKEKINDDAHIYDDLGADSLDGVEMMMAIEAAFEIEIPDEAAENIKQVKDIYSYLESISV